MAIKNSHQYVAIHHGCSRHFHRVSLGILVSSLMWAVLTDPVWAADSTAPFQDPQTQPMAVLQESDVAPITTSESAVSSGATWQIEIAYVVSEASSGVSHE